MGFFSKQKPSIREEVIPIRLTSEIIQMLINRMNRGSTIQEAINSINNQIPYQDVVSVLVAVNNQEAIEEDKIFRLISTGDTFVLKRSQYFILLVELLRQIKDFSSERIIDSLSALFVEIIIYLSSDFQMQEELFKHNGSPNTLAKQFIR